MASRRKKPVTDVVAGEHIFPDTRLTQKVYRWKELVAKKRHKEAMKLLEEIIIESTPMFERFAQHEFFHKDVELPVLVSAAQEKVVRWLISWQPAKGRLFTWFSKCAKNAFRSEVVKVRQWRRRFHTYGPTQSKDERGLEALFGAIDPTVNRHALSSEIVRRISDIQSRWGDPQEIGCLRYILSSLMESQDRAIDKQAVIRGAAYCWGVSFESAKFFYNWATMEMRDALFGLIHIPYTEQDLFRSAFSYTDLPDLLNIISWDQLKRILVTRGGTRTKWPTIAQLVRLKEQYALYQAVDDSSKDPQTVSKIARSKGKTEKSATEVFTEMLDVLNPNRIGEYPIYDHHDPRLEE